MRWWRSDRICHMSILVVDTIQAALVPPASKSFSCSSSCGYLETDQNQAGTAGASTSHDNGQWLSKNLCGESPSRSCWPHSFIKAQQDQDGKTMENQCKSLKSMFYESCSSAAVCLLVWAAFCWLRRAWHSKVIHGHSHPWNLHFWAQHLSGTIVVLAAHPKVSKERRCGRLFCKNDCTWKHALARSRERCSSLAGFG